MPLIHFYMGRSILLTVMNPRLVSIVMWGDHIGRKFTGNADLMYILLLINQYSTSTTKNMIACDSTDMAAIIS